MSIDEMKALVRRLFDAHCRQDVEAAIACFSPDAMNHGQRVGREGFAFTYRNLYTIFPDYHWEEELLIAEGAWVVARVIVSGTHLGRTERAGLANITPETPPTGRRVAVMQAHFYRFEDGLIIEHRAVRDDFDLALQLGLLPDQAPPTGSGPTQPAPRHAGLAPN